MPIQKEDYDKLLDPNSSGEVIIDPLLQDMKNSIYNSVKNQITNTNSFTTQQLQQYMNAGSAYITTGTTTTGTTYYPNGTYGSGTYGSGTYGGATGTVGWSGGYQYDPILPVYVCPVCGNQGNCSCINPDLKDKFEAIQHIRCNKELHLIAITLRGKLVLLNHERKEWNALKLAQLSRYKIPFCFQLYLDIKQRLTLCGPTRHYMNTFALNGSFTEYLTRIQK